MTPANPQDETQGVVVLKVADATNLDRLRALASGIGLGNMLLIDSDFNGVALQIAPPVIETLEFSKMTYQPHEIPIPPRPSKFLPGNPKPWKKRWK